ncbi:hypothetical protein BC342_28185 [Streptomyces olivaceus]|nr:hypothetical protein BC342_28185 [Streptomyces olivaceus]
MAVGNASLLGIGYLILGRRRLFWSAAAVTAVLLWLTYGTAATWAELLLVLWWAADGMDSGYCRKPAKYSAAPAYRKGRSGVVFAGDTEYTDKLPGEWRAGTSRAALVVCADEAGAGDVIETCQYRDHDGRIGSVRFNKLSVRVKAYALRTGRLVTDRTVQMGGESCPGILRYFGELPSRMAATPSDGDVRDAFGPVIGR